MTTTERARQRGDRIEIRIFGKWYPATYRGRSENGAYVVARRINRPTGKPVGRYVNLVRDGDVRDAGLTTETNGS